MENKLSQELQNTQPNQLKSTIQSQQFPEVQAEAIPYKKKNLYFIVLLLMLFVGIGGIVGYYSFIKTQPSLPVQRACTEEAKVCPDGSSVGRTGSNCEFAPCPSPTNPFTQISPTPKVMNSCAWCNGECVSASETTNSIVGIQTTTCCPCPKMIQPTLLGSDGWVLYEKGKDYSSLLPPECREHISCQPCEPMNETVDRCAATPSPVGYSCVKVDNQCKNVAEVIKETTTKQEKVLCNKENNCCEAHEDCRYFGYTGECSTPEYVAKIQKDAKEQGLRIGEAPPTRSDVTCTCESNSCVTNN